MTTAIVTDSNSGIYSAEAERLGILSIPMPIIIDGRTFYENVNITHAEFFSAMERDCDISTSQPTPGDVISTWKKALETADDLVYIPMSSALSGSCQSAQMLAEEFDGKVQVVDNHRISVSMYQSVMRASAFAGKGKNAVEIRKLLEAEGPESTIYLTVETLKYFRKSGRVTPAAAALGDLLNIKPVLCTRGGKFDVESNVHGLMKAKKTMINQIVSERNGQYRKLADDEIVISCADSFVDEADAVHWEEQVKKTFPEFEIFRRPLSLSIACHTGPNACGLAIFQKF